VQAYLEFFGVPLGKYEILVNYALPLKPLLLLGWLSATLLFIFPLLLGIFVLKKKSPAVLLYFWILTNLAGLAVYIMNLNAAYSRLVMPMFPALAMLWAVGFDRNLSTEKRQIVFLLFIAVAAVFVTADFSKAFIASNAWNRYEEDFLWIRENTPKDSFFYYRGQCLSYNINRHVDFRLNRPEAFIWINPDFPLEPVAQLNTTILHEFSNYTLVYSNEATGTEIYRVRK
jgi:hypothetical protein